MADRHKVFCIKFDSGLVWYGTTRGDIEDAVESVVAEHGFYGSYRVTLVDICRRQADAHYLIDTLIGNLRANRPHDEWADSGANALRPDSGKAVGGNRHGSPPLQLPVTATTVKPDQGNVGARRPASPAPSRDPGQAARTTASARPPSLDILPFGLT